MPYGPGVKQIHGGTQMVKPQYYTGTNGMVYTVTTAGPDDISRHFSNAAGSTDCYSSDCASCWGGYAHTIAAHTKAVTEAKAERIAWLASRKGA